MTRGNSTSNPFAVRTRGRPTRRLAFSPDLFTSLRLIHNQSGRAKRDMNFPTNNAVHNLCNLSFDFTVVVETDEDCRANLALFRHYVVGRTSVICAGLIDAVTLP